MNKLSKLLLCILCLSLPGFAFAQETALKKGESITLRISGVPAEDVGLVSAKYGISDAGTIRLPYLKIEISAAGLKPSALARKIEAAYRTAQIYTQPVIQVDATTPESAQQRFLSVVGEVKAPQGVGVVPGMTLMDAIARCGGFTDFADVKKIKLTRGGKVSYHDLKSSDPKQNINVQANDLITVRQRGRLFR